MSELSAKEETLRAAIDVLAETLLAFKQDAHYTELKEIISTTIVQAPVVEERSLMIFASDKLEEELEKKGAHAAPIARTFLAKMKRERGME